MRKLYLDLGNTYIVGDEIDNRCYVKTWKLWHRKKGESENSTIELRYNNNKN